MTIYDAAMVGIIILGLIWGAFRGITWQLASMASLVLGYAVAFPLSSQLAVHFPGEPIVARALALLASYVGVSGGCFLVAWLVRATLRQWRFEAFDRHLGMLLGGMEGALIGIVVTLFVVSLAPQTRGPIFSSRSGKVVSVVMDAVEPIMPSEIRAELSPFWGSSEGGTMNAQLPAQPQNDAAPVTATDPGQDLQKLEEQGGKVLRRLVQEGESELNQSLKNAADQQIDQVTGTGQRDGRTVERR